MISKEVFGWNRQSADGIRRMRPMRDMFIVECRTCGYEPEEQDSIPTGRCPHCFATTWRRFPRPGALITAVKW